MARSTPLALLAATAAAAAAATPAQPSNWSLVFLDTSLGALCLDGSPPAYYYRPGVGAGQNKWILHMQGGGWCTSTGDCSSRANSSLGSSTSWPRTGAPTADGGDAGILSPDPAVNPLFHDWAVAYLGYCDGGSYAGSVAEPVPVGPGSDVIFYRGRHILDAFVAKLLSAGVASASDVILSGCSAGGLAVFLHADYVGSLLPPSVRFSAAPGAGFFLADFQQFGGGYEYLANYQWVAATMNVTANVDAGCVAYYTAQPGAPLWKCFTAPYTLPFVTTPTFVSNSLADSWQAGNIMAFKCDPTGSACNATEIAYLDSFRAAMVAAMAPVLQSKTHGAFLQECFVHVVLGTDRSWNGTRVGGQTMTDTFQRWYYGTGPAASAVAVDGPWGGQTTCS